MTKDGEVVGGAVNRKANTREFLTAAERDMCVGTADPFDAAHGVMDFRGFYVSAAVLVRGGGGGVELRKLGQAKPRKYPASAMASDRAGAPTVGHDSVLDATYEAQKRLAGIPGIGVGGGQSENEAMLHPRNRDLLRPRT